MNMTHWISFFKITLLIFATQNLNGWASPPSSSKNYYLDAVNIRAIIQRDGSMTIEESRSYRFRGSFSWADYSVPVSDLGNISDFRLSENGNLYVPSDTKTPGSYQLQSTTDKFYVKWYYRAKNETRTFTLHYRIEDVIRLHLDTAELYFKFAGANREKIIGEFDVQLNFPYHADTSHVRAWMHGPLNGSYQFRDGKINFRVAPLSKKDFFEVRAIFPTDWAHATRQQSRQQMQEKILAEEAELVKKSNLLKQKQLHQKKMIEEHQQTAFDLNVIVAVLGLIAFGFLYNRYGRSHSVMGMHGKFSSEIPPDISPAVAHYYNTMQINVGAIMATIFDLARRGFLQLSEHRQSIEFVRLKLSKRIYQLKLNRRFYEKGKNRLLAHEHNLIDFIFNELAADGTEIQMNQIQSARSQVLKWFTKWKKLVKQQAGNPSFFDRESIKGTIISVVIAIVIIAIGIVSLIYFHTTGLIALLSGIFLLFISPLILRYTQNVKTIRSQLAALKRYITRYENHKHSGNLLANFERYFIFGVALGISSKAIKKLIQTIPDWDSNRYFPWYAAHLSSSSGFSDSISSMVSATSIAMGSATGVGGGSSSGGASGGAG